MTQKDRCREVRELMAAFLDDELAGDVSHGIQEHLAACPPCGGFSRLEQAFTSAMRARIGRVEAPAAFVAEMGKRMKDLGTPASRSGHAPRRLPGLWRIGYGLAVAALVAAILIPAAEMVSPGLLHRLTHPAREIRSAGGVLVCVECEKQGATLEAQRRCRKQGHQTGLRCPETGLWNLVVNETSLPLMHDPEIRGTQVTVEGRFLEDIRHIDAQTIAMRPGA